MSPASDYERGFRHGYQKAIEDLMNGEPSTMIPTEIAQLPLDAVNLSSRARNCLHYAGCRCLADVCGLSEIQISMMRNLGKKTSAEIAEVLEDHGLCHTHWSKYRINED